MLNEFRKTSGVLAVIGQIDRHAEFATSRPVGPEEHRLIDEDPNIQ